MNDAEIQKDIEEKQQYLRDEIMNKNFDVDEFSEFMSQYKENGLELTNWTFDELKEAVKKFKNNIHGQNKEEEEQNIEKGVENIRQSYIFNSIQYPNLETTNNLNNTNNNIKINYGYDVINYNNLQNYKNINNDNNSVENKHINKNNENKDENGSNNSNALSEEYDTSKKEQNNKENAQVQGLSNIAQNNNDNKPEIDNRQREYAEFEILDESNINNYEGTKEVIQCVKQSENLLTKNNNLYVSLDS